jgi:hypothetical protein
MGEKVPETSKRMGLTDRGLGWGPLPLHPRDRSRQATQFPPPTLGLGLFCLAPEW